MCPRVLPTQASPGTGLYLRGAPAAPVALPYDRPVPPPMPELPGVSHSFHEVRGVRLHVAEAGEGNPLVLLHGWPQSWWCWHKVIPALAESGFRVIAPDLRGYGWSEEVPGGYEKESFARDLVALLDELGLERVQLIGHDWGAMAGF